MESRSLFWQLGPSSPTSTSCPPDVIHMMNVPRPSLFSRSSAPMYYCEHKWKVKTGEAWERGYLCTFCSKSPKTHNCCALEWGSFLGQYVILCQKCSRPGALPYYTMTFTGFCLGHIQIAILQYHLTVVLWSV